MTAPIDMQAECPDHRGAIPHPSSNCYKNHGCRCTPCYKADERSKEQARLRDKRRHILSPAQLAKLRRQVGLPEILDPSVRYDK